MEEALEELGWEKMEEGTTQAQIKKQIYTVKGKEKAEEIISEAEKQKEHENYVKWWKGEQEEKENTRQKNEQKANLSSTDFARPKLAEGFFRRKFHGRQAHFFPLRLFDVGRSGRDWD